MSTSPNGSTREQGQFLARFRSPVFGWIQLIAMLFWVLQPWSASKAIYAPDESGNPYWLDAGDYNYGPPDSSDNDMNGQSDWLDLFNNAVTSGTVIWWSGGTFVENGAYTSLGGQWVWNEDSDGDGLPETVDYYPQDAANNSVWWGGTVQVNSSYVNSYVTISPRWWSNTSGSDGNGVPYAVSDVMANVQGNQMFWWNGGTFLIDGSTSTFDGQYFYGYDGTDSDGDEIPDVLDPYPNDAWNNTYYYWGGYDYLIDGVWTSFPGATYPGLWSDSDGDGIPDAADPYPSDPTNHTQWWGGGMHLIDGVWTMIGGQYYGGTSGSLPDTDGDGIPDLFDPYPNDASNNSIWWNGGDYTDINGSTNHYYGQYHRADAVDSDGDGVPDDLESPNGTPPYYWSGGTFTVDGQSVYFQPGYYGQFLDGDGDGIPDTLDTHPNDSTNGNYYQWGDMTITIDNAPHYFPLATYSSPYMDSDGDGIPDPADQHPSDPTNGNDLDNDGIPDLVELTYGFNYASCNDPRNVGGVQDGLSWKQAYQNGLLDTLLDSNTDSDADGMSDVYEITHGLNRFNPLDALDTPAGDYVFNFEKAQQGLDLITPVNPEDYFSVTGRSLATVLTYHNPNKSNAENDWDGDGISNKDELLVFGTDPRDGESAPTLVDIATVLGAGPGFGSVTTRLNFAWVLVSATPPPRNPSGGGSSNPVSQLNQNAGLGTAHSFAPGEGVGTGSVAVSGQDTTSYKYSTRDYLTGPLLTAQWTWHTEGDYRDPETHIPKFSRGEPITALPASTVQDDVTAVYPYLGTNKIVPVGAEGHLGTGTNVHSAAYHMTGPHTGIPLASDENETLISSVKFHWDGGAPEDVVFTLERVNIDADTGIDIDSARINIGFAAGHETPDWVEVNGARSTRLPLDDTLLFSPPADSNGVWLNINQWIVLRWYQPEPGLHSATQDGTGSSYRKVALNGQPMPDERPEASAEDDQPKEQTFIDAFSGRLEHSVSDVYVPLASSKLHLETTRTAVDETWSRRYGFRPCERLDRPFGAGWASNLVSYIGVNPYSAWDYYAIDENGQESEFMDYYDTVNDKEYFIPSRKEHANAKASHETLRVDWANGYYILQKKYGTTCYYDANLTIVQPRAYRDRFIDAEPDFDHPDYLYRLVMVTDGFGNAITYHYPNAATLIPNSISYLGDEVMHIEQNNVGLVTGVSWPSGEVVSYNYEEHSSNFHGEFESAEPVWVLASVTKGGHTVHYDYDLLEESPDWDTSSASVTYHTAVTSITDENEHQYQFDYVLDSSQTYTTAGGISQIQTGVPRRVSQVHLPENLGATSITNLEPTVEQVGAGVGRVTKIRGRAGEYTYAFSHQQTWESRPDYWPFTWTSPTYQRPIFLLDAGKVAAVNHSRELVLYYTQMDVKSAAGTETYTFNFDAGMAVSSVTDLSGNVRQYGYTDENDAGGFPGWDLPVIVQGVEVAHINKPPQDFLFDDPTSATNAQLDVTRYTYDSESRLMTSVTTPRGIVHEAVLDSSHWLHMEDKVKEANGTVIARTSYEYGNMDFPEFVTKKIVHRVADDPSDFPDLVTEFTPDAYGRVFNQVVDPDHFALTTTTEYDLDYQKRFVTDPRGNVMEFQYGNHRLVKTIFPDSNFKTREYDARGNLTAEVNERGARTEYTYDVLNRRKVTKVQLGTTTGGAPVYAQKEVTAYTGKNLVDTETDFRGVQTKYHYDLAGRITSTVTDGLTTSFEYGENSGSSLFENSRFKPTKITDPKGNVATMTYDELYRLVSKTMESGDTPALPLGQTVTIYDADGNAVRSATMVSAETPATPRWHLTHTDFDGLNRPAQKTYWDDQVSWDNLSSTVPTSVAVSTSSKYTSTGQTWQTTDEMEHVTTMAFDTAGRASQVTAPELSSRTPAASPVTHKYYDANSNVWAVKDPLDNVTTTTYDNRNRPEDVTTPPVYDLATSTWLSPVTHTEYDAVGNVTSITDPMGNVTHKEYDLGNRLTTVTDALHGETDTTYDDNGNVKTVTDPNGHVTTNHYDNRNHLTSTLDAASHTTTFEYDDDGNRTLVKDGNEHSTTFTYDGLNRPTSENYADGTSKIYGYNYVQKITYDDGRGHIIDYTYDARDRLKTVSFTDDAGQPGGRTYEYDKSGHLCYVTETGRPEANVECTYDELGNILTEKSRGQTTTYGYDLASHCTDITFPTGRSVQKAYDGAGRLVQITDGNRKTNYYYDKNSRAISQWMPNGQYDVNSYDAMGRLIHRKAYASSSQDSTALKVQFDWEYDPAGNLSLQTEQWPNTSLRAAGTRSARMEYDEVDHLTLEHVEEPDETVKETAYTYDAGANRLSKEIKDGQGNTLSHVDYTYNAANQLTHWSETDGGWREVSLQYDSAGNRSRQDITLASGEVDTTLYSWDREGRLTKVNTSPQTHEYGYGYDYRTRRITRTEDGVSTALVFNGGLSAAEYPIATPQSSISSPESATVEYQRGPDMGGGVGGLLYSMRGERLRFNLHNARGDVVAQSNLEGVLTWSASYEAFGKRPVEAGVNLDRQRASSKDEDPTGLLNEGFRYRDLETGVFLSRDPAGFVDGPNLYTYVKQNPWTKFDPQGLMSWGAFGMGVLNGLVWGAIGAALIAAIPVTTTVGAIVATGLLAWGLSSAIVTTTEICTGREYGTGRVLSDEEQSYKGGTLIGGAIGGGYMSKFLGGLFGENPLSASRYQPRTSAESSGELPTNSAINDAVKSDVYTKASTEDARSGGSTLQYRAHSGEGAEGIRGTIDEFGMVDFVYKTGPETPSGAEMFNGMMEHFGSNVRGIRGNWYPGELPTNFDVYKQGIRDGLSPEDAAALTPTGKNATRAGFGDVNVITDTDSTVEVEFNPTSSTDEDS